MNTPRFQEAVSYACDVHADQTRKGSDIPYVSHLLSVAALVIENGGSEDEAIAALLHDAAEDQGGMKRLEDIRGRFGNRVAETVHECSDTLQTENKPPWLQRKQNFINTIPEKSSSAHLVILADKLHNARSILTDYRQHGEALWDRFKAGERDSVLWYYRSVSNALAEQVGDHPLAEELDRVIKEIQNTLEILEPNSE